MSPKNEPEITIVGWSAIHLTQGKYNKGRLYVSGLLQLDQLVALDIRYFIEGGDCVFPTRKGFRIPVENLQTFLRVMRKKPDKELRDFVLWKRGKRSLLVNFKLDMFGEGVDVRYYLDSNTYTGWEQRGIRFLIQDWEKVSKEICSLNLNQNIPDRKNLFRSKPIRKYEKKEREKQGPNIHPDQKSLHVEANQVINQSILELLEEM